MTVDNDDTSKRLNDPAVLPANAYRRNHINYELVGYVNCLIGCRISGNSKGEALFAERIKQFMTDHPQTSDVAIYYETVANFVGSTR